MDVDNLGHAFSTGFEVHKATFSRYSALSRTLDFFFKGYLNTLWKDGKTDKGEAFNKHTFIVYAGGDDLFIVGRWDILIEFAAQIQEQFAAYACHNPALTLSGGIAVVPPKFPISKGASQAADAEKQAKNHVYYHKNDDGTEKSYEKNAFTLFNVPLNWQHEYPHVKALKEELMGLLKQDAPRSILHKIRQHHAAFMEWKNAQKAGGYAVERWRWQMAYDFGRLASSLRKNHKEVADAIDRFAIDAFTYDDRNNLPAANGGFKNITYLERLNLAARWAELEW
jgi:CRISPR-associated protein Csm1